MTPFCRADRSRRSAGEGAWTCRRILNREGKPCTNCNRRRRWAKNMIDPWRREAPLSTGCDGNAAGGCQPWGLLGEACFAELSSNTARLNDQGPVKPFVRAKQRGSCRIGQLCTSTIFAVQTYSWAAPAIFPTGAPRAKSTPQECGHDELLQALRSRCNRHALVAQRALPCPP